MIQQLADLLGTIDLAVEAQRAPAFGKARLNRSAELTAGNLQRLILVNQFFGTAEGIQLAEAEVGDAIVALQADVTVLLVQTLRIGAGRKRLCQLIGPL